MLLIFCCTSEIHLNKPSWLAPFHSIFSTILSQQKAFDNYDNRYDFPYNCQYLDCILIFLPLDFFLFFFFLFFFLFPFFFWNVNYALWALKDNEGYKARKQVEALPRKARASKHQSKSKEWAERPPFNRESGMELVTLGTCKKKVVRLCSGYWAQSMALKSVSSAS